jgi:type II secretory ATPase GspE/PulE/Tfp pilus assembly ATPase PilB-like protein
MLDLDQRDLVREVSARLRRPVRPVRLNAYEIRRAISMGFEGEDPARDRLTLSLRPVRDFDFNAEGSQTEIPQLVDDILGHGVQLGASDVHIEAYEHDVDVRFRIDGLMRQFATPVSRDNIQGVITRLKVLSGLDIAEKRRAQDGRIQALFEDRKDGHRHERAVDFRLSIVPGPFGEDAVLRILDGTTSILPLEKLGFDPEVLTTFERMIANPEGMILVTGPTGSGKTTTLYGAIARISRPDIKILTAEDPIEYYFPKINQKQVSEQMSFAAYARSFLRQNPDVILIGEVRDEETASAALRAAQTGHLVLSTLHTNDAVRTVSRLRTLGIDSSLIAGSLLGALSQRLVRRLCPHCREEAAPEPNQAERLHLEPGDRAFFRSRGCEVCGGDGYKGRLGIYELFVLDGELADLVARETPVHQVRAAAVERGMRTLLDDALAKARAGLTSLEEVLRTVPYRLLEGG